MADTSIMASQLAHQQSVCASRHLPSAAAGTNHLLPAPPQVLARHAERERRRRRTQQRKVVLCLDGEYPDVPQNLAHIMLTLARECCAQVRP